MPRPSIRSIVPLLLLAAALAGCSRTAGDSPGNLVGPGGSTGATENDEAAVAATMSEAPEFVEDGLMEDESQIDLGSALVAGDFSAMIRPVRFWRKIERVERSFRIAFADTDSTGRPTTAHVAVHKLMTGSFNILAGERSEGGDVEATRDTLRLVRKRLVDHWQRHLLLKRVPPPPGDLALHPDTRPRWRIAATSGVKVTSQNATTRIVSLRIQSGPLDTTVVDPLELFRLRRVLHFPADVPVVLTVTTERDDDVVLFYRGLGRFRFHNNGDQTYSARFETGWFRGLQHFAVNALSNGTLFDDEAPYDSQAWILPYVVAPEILAEYVP